MELKYLNPQYLIEALSIGGAGDAKLDALINAYIVMLVAGKDVAQHMPDACAAHPTDSLEDARCLIPQDWFLEAMGEKVSPIIYAKDKHNFLGYYAKLQHRDGGRLQEAKALSLERALCIVAIKALHIKYGGGDGR